MTPPKPYAVLGSVTIYHGDSRVIAPQLRYDCVVSDPPYGLSYNHGPDAQGKHAFSNRRNTTPVAMDDRPFDPTPWLDRPAILWGANCYANRLPSMPQNPPFPCWLVWDKVTANGLNLRIGEVELAYTNCVARPQCFRYLWSGAYRKEERGDFLHPTQKPVALMAWCISLVRPVPRVILDPFMGSGSTLKAAELEGFSAIGIELEAEYIEIARRRIASDAPLFAEVEA